MAVKVAEPLLQIVAELTANGVAGFTVTVDVMVLTGHESTLPEMVYTVVEVGLAVTTLPVAELRVAAGVQVKLEAPVAVKVVEPPLQIVAELTVRLVERN